MNLFSIFFFSLLLPVLLCTGYLSHSPYICGISQNAKRNFLSRGPIMCVVNNQKKSAPVAKKSILGSKLKSQSAATSPKKVPTVTSQKNAPPPAGKPTGTVTQAVTQEQKGGNKDFKKEPKKIQPAVSAISSSITVSSSSKSVSTVSTLQSEGDVDNANLDSLIIDDGFRTALKDFRKANAPKKLLRAVADYSESGKLDQNMTVHAFRTLQRMNRNDLCADLIPYWHSAVDKVADQMIEIEPSVSLIRSCCKLQRVDLAEGIALRGGVNLESLQSLLKGNSTTEVLSPYAYNAHSRFLPELSLGYASIGSYPKALAALGMMNKFSIKIEIEISKQILKMFLRETGPEDVRKCLRALLLINGLSDNDSIQLLTSTYMKSIEFVKGAVSMDTLPPAECSEAAFIGRSNVGKSSLINMISNRKGIAFVSKTPGKTSEFNYFDAKGRVGKKNERHRFYLVDLPGVGYAEVRKELRASWLVLLRDYVVNRETLKIVFHLIDSRHGILDTDEECLSLLAVLPPHVQYVIVLTKVDKHNTGVRRDVLDRIANVVKQRTDRQVPIVYTSSETREGGAEIWSVLLDAVAGESSNDFYSEERI